MTHAYPFKTLDQARRAREAMEEVATWDADTVVAVGYAMPQVALSAGHKYPDWYVTVAMLRTQGETPQIAAERIGLWIKLHAERYGNPPTQRSLQRTV